MYIEKSLLITILLNFILVQTISFAIGYFVLIISVISKSKLSFQNEQSPYRKT